MRYNVSQLNKEAQHGGYSYGSRPRGRTNQNAGGGDAGGNGPVRVLLTRIAAEKELPFTLRVPNAETRAAMKEADEIARNHSARFSSAEELFASLEKDSGR